MKRTILFFVPFAVLITCAKGPKPEDILVRLDDKVITKEDFLKRTELAVRPAPLMKKEIALNNLILEKMLAVEAEKNEPIIDRPAFDAYIKGIQEQEMREMLFEKHAVDKVSVTDEEIEHRFNMSMRDYRVAYYSINNEKTALTIKQNIKDNPEQAAAIFDELGDGKPPVREVKWKDPDPRVVHEALYANPINLNAVIGPIKTDADTYIIMKILAWKDQPFISPEDAQVRKKEVKDRLTLTKAQVKWDEYVGKLMHGKGINFNEDTFNRMMRFYATLFSEKDQEKKEILVNNFFKNPEEMKASDDPDENVVSKDAPFFEIDGKVWTVRDFVTAIASHPLVYRNKNIQRSQFPNQFKYAVADLVRDQYLDREAYKESLDKSERVRDTVNMWKDANIAYYYRNKIVKNAIQSGQIAATDKLARRAFWESYVDSLYHKYQNNLQINHPEFDKIKLTGMGLAAYRPNHPYPMASPAFPQYTSDPLPETGGNQ